MDPQPGCQGKGHRRRPGPGADHGIGDAGLDPFVDQGGGKGGLYAHRAWHSMSNNAARWFRAARGPAARIHPDRPSVGALRRPAGAGPHPRSPSTCPATPDRTRCGPTCPRRPTWCARPSLPPSAPGRCDLLGYSLGARVALHVVTGTDLDVGRLVLIGATGGIEDPVARRERREADDAHRRRTRGVGGRRGLHRAVGQRSDVRPVWPTRPRPPSGCATRATGLASSLRLAGTGTQEPLWDRMPAPCAGPSRSGRSR